MDGIWGGVISGLITSFVVGLFLLWKGDRLVLTLKNMPNSWKVKYLTKVYLHAIKKNDYNFSHSIMVSFVSAFFLAPIFFSISIYSKLLRLRELVNEESLELADLPIEPGILSSALIEHGPWTLIIISTISLFLFFKQITMLLIDSLAPIVSKRLEYLRSAVCKCGTNEQYIHFFNLKAKCNNQEQIIEWLEYGNECLGDTSLDDIDEMINSLTNSKDLQTTFPSFLK
ncbi:hypothetical protein AB4369_20805 [Vibrio sp. 10N.261.49.A5]|uniref:hypothetical protein n=1 Tax=Vibrio sp. 10N.261.49.A5 TaxID=3229670 RepID=UPI00355430CB